MRDVDKNYARFAKLSYGVCVIQYHRFFFWTITVANDW